MEIYYKTLITNRPSPKLGQTRAPKEKERELKEQIEAHNFRLCAIEFQGRQARVLSVY